MEEILTGLAKLTSSTFYDTDGSFRAKGIRKHLCLENYLLATLFVQFSKCLLSNSIIPRTMHVPAMLPTQPRKPRVAVYVSRNHLYWWLLTFEQTFVAAGNGILPCDPIQTWPNAPIRSADAFLPEQENLGLGSKDGSGVTPRTAWFFPLKVYFQDLKLFESSICLGRKGVVLIWFGFGGKNSVTRILTPKFPPQSCWGHWVTSGRPPILFEQTFFLFLLFLLNDAFW